MFYGRTTNNDGYGGGGGPRGNNRNDRLEQMSKQQQLIEQKKREIQLKLEAERQRKALEAAMKESGASTAGRDSNSSSPSSSSNKQSSQDTGVVAELEKNKPSVVNTFVNDGSFFIQFQRMQEEARKKKEEEDEKKKEEEYEQAENAMKCVTPVIKILNAEAAAGVRTPSPNYSNHQQTPPPPPPPPPPVKSNTVPPPSFYQVPPPPPPPPVQQQNQQMHGNHYVLPPPPPPPLPMNDSNNGGNGKNFGSFPSPAVKALAMRIAAEGDDFEERARVTSQGDPLMWFLYRPDSAEYRRFRDLVRSVKQEQGLQYGNMPSIKKEQPEPEYGGGKGDTDLRAEYGGGGNNSEYGSGFRIKKETDTDYRNKTASEYGTSEYGGKSEYGSLEYGGGNVKLCSSEYGSKPNPDYNNLERGIKSEYGIGLVKTEPSEISAKSSEHGFVYGGKMVEPKAEYGGHDIKTEYGAPNRDVKVDQDDRIPKVEYGSEYGSDNSQSGGGIKREASSGDEEDERERRERKRRSRWGPQSSNAPPVAIVAPGVVDEPPVGPNPWIMNPMPGSSAQQSPFQMTPQQQSEPNLSMMGMPVISIEGPSTINKVTRTNPQLSAYAKQAYGTTDLDDEQWKQCEEAYKMNLVFHDIAQKKARDAQLEKAGKFKHEYDSDEDVDDTGTWEHKQRMKEMEKTRKWADELTQKAKGKHHIGDFLPPDELAKFMEKYQAVKEGRRLEQSDYQEFKIQQDNIGFKMLQKMGWSDGQGLGAAGQGILAPIDKGNVATEKQGLGIEKPSELNEEDDEYTAYRKRMMLAYRFRPNPLNNPRRPYY